LTKSLGIGDNGSGEFIAIEKLDNLNFRIVLSPFLIEEEAHIEIGILSPTFRAFRKWYRMVQLVKYCYCSDNLFRIT
jgi:hypothetical protein